jgi:transcriptional regulator with XRE-family HTH domain
LEKNRLAKRIRAFRKLKGYTQLELAEELGISIGILGAVERGTRMPDQRLIERVADTLGISVAELLPERDGKEE